jgi:hemolysin activation/secretion protein
LGGKGSLRGFNEHRFSGYRIGWSNLELRLLLSRDSRVFLFSDYGYVKSTNYTFGILFGFGFGIRIETKLGMLGIDYGLGYLKGKLQNPLDGIIHFGIETKI